MRVLGIDTATSATSVALVENGSIIADERESSCAPGSEAKRSPLRIGRGEILLPLVESVLAKSGASLAELDGIAVSIGPGSFTGLRIGLGTVKGLAYGADLPVVGISTLHANAARVSDFQGLICSLLDAGKNEVFASFFRRPADCPVRLTEDAIAPIYSVIDQAQRLSAGAPCLIIGDGVAVHGKLLAASFGAEIRACRGDDYPSLASAVARLGEQRLRHAEVDCLGSLAPVYLRLSEAEKKRKESANYLKTNGEPTLTKIPS